MDAASQMWSIHVFLKFDSFCQSYCNTDREGSKSPQWNLYNRRSCSHILGSGIINNSLENGKAKFLLLYVSRIFGKMGWMTSLLLQDASVYFLASPVPQCDITRLLVLVLADMLVSLNSVIPTRHHDYQCGHNLQSEQFVYLLPSCNRNYPH